MADETANAVPSRPPAGEIVSQRALLNTQFALYRNTLAFGGVRDPSIIWSSMLRDDGSAILYYRELEEKDVDVANALDTLKGSVLERNWTIEPADKDDTKAVEVAQFVEDQFSHIANLDNMLDNMLDAPGYGFSVQELIFDASEGQAELVDVHDCPQELFLFNNRYTPQIGPLQFLDSPYAGEGALVPEEKFLIYSYRMRSRNRMGRPLLRSVFWPSWFKRNMLRLWAQYAEKGPGTAVVRYGDADNAQEQQKAADLAQALIEQVAVAVPAGFEYDKELLTIARALNPDVYEKFFQSQQLDIVRRILGETLTSFGGEQGKGTQALGEVHADTMESRTVGLCKGVMSILNRQLIRPLVLWNFGPDAPMPKFAYDIEEKEDLTEQLGIVTGVYELGVQVPVSYVQERFGIPAADGDEPVLSKPVNVAPVENIRETTTGTFSEIAGRMERSRKRLAEWYREFAEGNGRAPTFAEVQAASRLTFAAEMDLAEQPEAEKQMSQFDNLVLQLQKESMELMTERVDQVARALENKGAR
jgi:phage gp29-like protein